MGKNRALSHDDVKRIVGDAIRKASEGTDEEFAETIGASSSAVTTWRNRKQEMGSFFLMNAMSLHPTFLAELLFAIGYKPIPLTDAETNDREFTVALAALQLKHAQAIADGKVDHNELIGMSDELDEVGQGVECRRAKVRRLRSVK